MRLRNVNGEKLSGDTGDSSSEDGVEEKDDGNLVLSDDDYDESGDGIETWQPSLKRCLKYLADSSWFLVKAVISWSDLYGSSTPFDGKKPMTFFIDQIAFFYALVYIVLVSCAPMFTFIIFLLEIQF
ncbi:uncharacterized protein LOC111445877 isoform X1 [Cucurbita moschata]|uniref:Uncharacterized protein LOC111445877 isoform X1 n=1 Tax=Cucurbita moschata TaxID=3662 RepID=A0A6J1FHP9_CUCMO|nr:uncharacterized protein LOC111445877 isoform X1 [Cucurbita moschata]